MDKPLFIRTEEHGGMMLNAATIESISERFIYEWENGPVTPSKTVLDNYRCIAKSVSGASYLIPMSRDNLIKLIEDQADNRKLETGED